MPYLTLRERAIVDNSGVAINAGELNYRLTRLCLSAPARLSAVELCEELRFVCMGFLGDEYRYANLNDVIGALECCRLEIGRRAPAHGEELRDALSEVKQQFYDEVVAPYEDAKCEQNGDVFA